ncbi:MAG: mycofactocin biosynthesis glycosyltransferase MftF [Actinomycetota bacterium]|nr:mycofactocin biosynthesis glycosyltransferase MftF [Actinomycetota bacterium]
MSGSGAAPVRYLLDRSWRRPGDGTVVVAGSPLRLFRLSTGGAQVVAMVEAGEAPDTAAIRQLLDRFVDAGALHPVHGHGPFTAADVTVVIPSYGPLSTELLAQLRALLPPDVPTIVVDDATPSANFSSPRAPHSSKPEPEPEADATLENAVHVMAPPPPTVIRHDVNRGPAAARNTGLAAVATPLVLFLDTDVSLPSSTADGQPGAGWLQTLLAHFADDRVALVAPRVAGAPGPSWLAGYERRHSPLDLGDQPARVAAGTRVSYVPAAALLCRTEAIRSLGGFDPVMRLGEDVDLVWRLSAAGHRCRYEPAVVAHHRPRAGLGEWLRQRFGYGRSAAALARRHPGALSPVRLSGWSALVWALVVARRPAVAAGVAAGTVVALRRKLADLPASESLRLVGLGHLAAGRQLAEAVTRVWWPLALVAAAVSRRARLPVLAAFVAPSLLDAVAGRSTQPLADAPLLLAEQMAYGAGVWTGVVQEREAGPLLPELTTWPKRGGG